MEETFSGKDVNRSIGSEVRGFISDFGNLPFFTTNLTNTSICI